VLGLNEKESYAVCEALALEPGPDSHTGLLERISAIRGKTGIPEVVIHPHHFAAAAGPAGSGAADGPYCRRPKLTTGAGDHFNGGYVSARLRGLSPEQAVIIGQAASGFYVRQGRGPSGEELTRFCELWAEGTLDPWKPVGD
jgi:sugar/nucleoside kinase (ribokinase family)